MFLRLRILLSGLLKNFSKFYAGSISSGIQIMVGRSGCLPFKKVPLSWTSLVDALFWAFELIILDCEKTNEEVLLQTPP